jgi:hypothetical protein
MRRKFGWNYRSNLKRKWGKSWIFELKIYWRGLNNRRYLPNDKGHFMNNSRRSSFKNIRFGSPQFKNIINNKYGPNWKGNFQRRFGKINWKKRVKSYWKRRFTNNNVNSKNHWNKRNKRSYRWNSKGHHFINSRFSKYQNVKFGSHKFKRIMQRKLGPHWIKTLKRKWGQREWLMRLRKVWTNRKNKKQYWNNRGRFLSNSEWSGYKRKYCWDPKGKRYYNAKWTFHNEKTNIMKPEDCVIVTRNRNNGLKLNYYRSIGNGSNKMFRFTVKN